jgi:hypothetical protein
MKHFNKIHYPPDASVVRLKRYYKMLGPNIKMLMVLFGILSFRDPVYLRHLRQFVLVDTYCALSLTLRHIYLSSL